MIKASVIAAFYNRLDYLKFVLAGLERQTEKKFELIIADDGSQKEISNEIKKISNYYSFQIKQVWHEDKGFRKNKILNSAIRNSRADYLIFIDADCVPHRAFIEAHLNFSKPNTSLTGRRVNLSQKITSQLTEGKVRDGILENSSLKLLLDSVFGKTNYLEKGIYFKNRFLLNFFNRKTRGLLGCNFSLFKEDIFKVNGFDERYGLPSIGEDSDIQFRLELAGLKIKSVNHSAIQYHLYHEPQTRSAENLKLFEQLKKNKICYTPDGLNK
ncbi:MAG: glycosyltransferase [Ignavibacteria bacterium]|nr:glycosyltransferase [Ignavibacteria bacterium]MBT8381393.1 glycosyltransferase [Ignavibacteria bacterium]MBT8392917.1 glycosyltransferase [Ignavibacteria bacterium]NNJ53338.1 glycosyltransferase [Ignavibacteriaceae bacterium]NNL20120.1 glycosyltransferase [Ignavibacteriaceae bacterium]